MTETLANGYSYESTQCELSNEYQDDRVYMVCKNLCLLVLWTKVASELEGLSVEAKTYHLLSRTNDNEQSSHGNLMYNLVRPWS